MAALVQVGNSITRGAVAATFGSPCTAGNMMIAFLVAENASPSLSPADDAGGYVAAGWTWVGAVEARGQNEQHEQRARVYAKPSIGGETQIHRIHNSTDYHMTIAEVSGVALAELSILSVDLFDAPNPATMDLGDFSGDGFALALFTVGRDHGAVTAWTFTPSSGWTAPNIYSGWLESAELKHDLLMYRSVSGAAAVEADVQETGGAGVGKYGGIALLFATVACDFEADILAPVPGETVSFTDLTTGGPDSWLWDFGDGATSTDQNPTHAYAAVGAYTVALTATRSADGDDCTETKVDYIVVVAPKGWDAFAAAAPNGARLATIQGPDSADSVDGATQRAVRVALNETGSGAFKINRYSPVATEAVLSRGNFIKCRFPWRADYDVGFWLEKGDFTLAHADEEGGEEFTFGGRGSLAYLDRAVMDAVAYTTGLDVVDKFTEIWHTTNVPQPTGIAFLPSDPDYVYVISRTKRRIYKVRQSDRKVVGTSPELWPGSTKYAGGLTADPTDATIMWALESPSVFGGSGNTKIRKIDITGAIGTWNVAATHDLGSAIQLTDIRASTGYLWTPRYNTGKIERRTRVAPTVVDNDWTVTYNGHAQTHPYGIAVSENGTGTEIAMWFGNSGGAVKRALIANLTNPASVTRTVNTSSIASFGGDWSLESGSDYFYMVNYVSSTTTKYQLTAATPHDPLDGKWRLDEGSPGAILWRVIQEAQAAGRPQQPLPDLAYAFTDALDTDGNTWDPHDGTMEFDAEVTESVLQVALRLLPYGLVEQMSPYLNLAAVNAADHGADRTGASFGAGVVRFEKGVNIVPELARQERERELHSHMLAVGKGSIYARATLADLGYVREGGITTDIEDVTALAGTADARLSDERVRSERIRFAVPIGDDEAAGEYLPWTHYNVGDLVTLHSGSGEHDFDNETFVLYAFTLAESESGSFEIAILELGSATLPTLLTDAGSAGSTAPGGNTTILTASPITFEGLDDTGATVSSGLGTKLRMAGLQFWQEAGGVVRGVVTAVGRLLDLDDVEADDIADGQTLVYDAADAAFVPGSLGDIDGLVEDLHTAETDVGKYFRPDGVGGLVADDLPAGGGGGGGVFAIPYTFDTTTADADPGSGKARLSNATQYLAVTLRADLADLNGADVTSLLDAVGAATSTVKAYVRIGHATDPTKWLVGTVSAVASPSGYRNITIANVSKSANSPFANGDAVMVSFDIATLAHHTTHEAGGGDAVAVTHAQTTGQTANDHHNQAHAIGGSDHTGALAHSALSGLAADDHTQYATNVEFDDHNARHEPGGADPMAVDAAAATGSLRTIGTSATSAAAGNDARLSDARTPTAHHTTHEAGGGDAVATTASIPFVIGDGSAVIATGLKGGFPVEFACTIVAWTILSTDGTSGAIVVDIWRDSYANFPPTVADTITGSEKPTITATAAKGQDTSLASGAGWAVAAGDVLYFNVDSVTSLKRVVISLKVTRTL